MEKEEKNQAKPSSFKHYDVQFILIVLVTDLETINMILSGGLFYCWLFGRFKANERRKNTPELQMFSMNSRERKKVISIYTNIKSEKEKKIHSSQNAEEEKNITAATIQQFLV